MERTNSYKKTEVGVIPEDWEVKRLGDIADITMGQSPSSKHYNFEYKGIPLIQGNADIMKRKTIKRVFTTHITKSCTAGDIIMTVRALLVRWEKLYLMPVLEGEYVQYPMRMIICITI